MFLTYLASTEGAISRIASAAALAEEGFYINVNKMFFTSENLINSDPFFINFLAWVFECK